MAKASASLLPKHINAMGYNSINKLKSIPATEERTKSWLSVFTVDRRKYEKMRFTSRAQITCSISFISKTLQKHEGNVVPKRLSPER